MLSPAQNALFEEHLPTVSAIARSIQAAHRSLGLELDDLFQDGCIGLLEAVNRCDFDRIDRFPAYAKKKIRGAIIDRLRDRHVEWRSGRVRQKRCARCEYRGNSDLMRCAAERCPALMVEVSIDAVTLFPIVQPEQPDYLFSAALAGLLVELDPQQRKLLVWRYRDNLPLREIGQRLGLTERQAWRLHAGALATLRAQIEAPRRMAA